jgi:hypothetical protein
MVIGNRNRARCVRVPALHDDVTVAPSHLDVSVLGKNPADFPTGENA